MVSISELGIKRLALAMILSFVRLLSGIIGFTYLGTREFPVINLSIVAEAAAYCH